MDLVEVLTAWSAPIEDLALVFANAKELFAHI